MLSTSSGCVTPLLMGLDGSIPIRLLGKAAKELHRFTRVVGREAGEATGTME